MPSSDDIKITWHSMPPDDIKIAWHSMPPDDIKITWLSMPPDDIKLHGIQSSGGIECHTIWISVSVLLRGECSFDNS
jgi:hypothetical protein